MFALTCRDLNRIVVQIVAAEGSFIASYRNLSDVFERARGSRSSKRRVYLSKGRRANTRAKLSTLRRHVETWSSGDSIISLRCFVPRQIRGRADSEEGSNDCAFSPLRSRNLTNSNNLILHSVFNVNTESHSTLLGGQWRQGTF